MDQRLLMPQRFYSLDSMRFVASLVIALAHYTLFAEAYAITKVLGGIYPLVEYFFILSGFVIMSAYHKLLNTFADYAIFLKARLARIYPLHFVVLSVYLLIGILNWTGIARAADQSKYDPSAIIPNLLLIHAWGTTDSLSFNYPSWSISAEWLVYLLFPIPLWLARRGGHLALAAAVVCIVLALNWAQHIGWLQDWTGATYNFGALRALPGFFAGVAVFVFLDRTRYSLTSYTPGLIVFAISVVTMLLRFDPLISLSLAVVVAILFGAAEIGNAGGILRNQKLVALGNASYAIYMIHPLIGTILITVIGKRLLGLSGTPLLVWALVVAGSVTVIAAPIVYEKIERRARKYIMSSGFGAVKGVTAPASGKSAIVIEQDLTKRSGGEYGNAA